MLVSRRDLERSLVEVAAEVAAEVGDPRVGIHGPGSASWRLNREVANFLGAGRAALLQLAHPFVAHAIDQHSATRTDARGRFQRTFANVFAMTFGDLDQALAAARRVHAVHARIAGIIDEDVGSFQRGTRYRANESSSLLWVHATLVDSVFAVNEALGFPLSPGEREEYYRQSIRFARLFGIPREEIPVDHVAFRSYVQEMLDSPVLAVGRPAREIADFLLASPSPALAPLAAWYRALTAALMPPRFREPFGLPFRRRERLAASLSLRALGRLYPLAPAPLRHLPGYLHAMERTGRAEGGVVGRLARRVTTPLWPDLAGKMAR